MGSPKVVSLAEVACYFFCALCDQPCSKVDTDLALMGALLFDKIVEGTKRTVLGIEPVGVVDCVSQTAFECLDDRYP